MAYRTFHVLYVPDGIVASCIDAIRVLANPTEKHRAHITVGGPYSYQRSWNILHGFNRLIESSEVYVRGVDNFFDSNQNTVYLKCGSPLLKDVWYKPDYGFNPHITLYDGSSSELARKLWNIVSSRNYDFSFIAGPLAPLVSSRRYQGGMALQADLDSKLLRDITGVDVDGVNVESLGEARRLEAIDKLCHFLSKFDSHLDFPKRESSTLESTEIELKEVEISSPVLSEIKELAKRNSSTLGFLPDGAFDAYAQRGWIVGATADRHIIGYVIYRISRMRAVLVHLCIEEKLRGQGIARKLFRSVVDRTGQLRGILANTRRDFPAHSLWPRLGFAAIGERPGRGKNRSVLTRWWYEHQHPTLFSSNVSYVGAQSPIDVAIDLNVFYDLVMPSSREGEDESRSLQSDWLVDEVQLCVTGELFNEITRLTSPQAREGQRALAHEFKLISGAAEAFQESYKVLESLMGGASNDRNASDLRHLAHSAAADVQFFVTRDSRILRFQEVIEKETGVTPLRPVDLVTEIDQIRNIASYQPVRFRGSTLQVGKVERQQRAKLEDHFVNSGLGEKKSSFRQRMSGILPSHPDVNSAVVYNNGEPIALYGFDTSEPNVLEVPCLRLRSGGLARTLARQIVTMAVDSSIANKYSMTAVTDNWLEPYVEEALAEGGFVKTGGKWLKLNYPAIGNEEEISNGLGRLLEKARDWGLGLPEAQKFPFGTGTRLTAVDIVQVEKNLRPLKLTNGTLDTVVIPVMPRWAQHLFDSNLAEQTLLGARPELVMNWENAYYRSARSLGNISAPFRILWYVSQDRRYLGTSQIRAYSLGSSVEVLPARLAYDRYKRLGVYNWEQVLEITGGDPEGPVMVVRFCDIELFKNPIARNRFGELLALTDQKKPSLRGPQPISEAAFAAIYNEGQS